MSGFEKMEEIKTFDPIEHPSAQHREKPKGLSPKKSMLMTNLKVEVQEPTPEENVLQCIRCRQSFTISATILESRVIEYCIPCYRLSMIRVTQEKLVFRPNFIEDKIYLGGHRTAENLSILEEYNISRVIVCGTGLQCRFPQKIEYLHFHIEDIEGQNISQCFQPAIDFILSSPQNVLVHCHAGVSRSASIVIAYLMFLHRNSRRSLEEIIRSVKARRPCIAPNIGFLMQLREFEKQLLVSSEEEEEPNFLDLNPN
jgi:hypothetical protein